MITARTGAVINDHRLGPDFLHFGGEELAEDADATTRHIGNHDANGSAREGLGSGWRRQGDDDARSAQSRNEADAVAALQSPYR